MMTREEVIRLAQQYCDYSSDSKGRESFEFDDYGLYHFAHLIAAQYEQDALRYRMLRSNERFSVDEKCADGHWEPLHYYDLDCALDEEIGEVK